MDLLRHVYAEAEEQSVNPTTEVKKNLVTGLVERDHVDRTTFEEQYRAFERQKKAEPTPAVPSGEGVAPSGAVVSKRKLRKKRKQLHGDPGDVANYRGPWASYLYEEERKTSNELNEDQKAYIEAQARKRQRRGNEEEAMNEDHAEAEPTALEETTMFHLEGTQDRSFMAPPLGHAKHPPKRCFVPKKEIHCWTGHTKAVNAIRFLPGSAHLLLSASSDKTVKIWSVYGKRKCVRTYKGHQEAVRDIDFCNDGTKFLSTSYDKFIKYWDTETGQVIARMTSKQMPFCGRFYPVNNNQFLSGQRNKLIVQYDLRSKHICQRYDEHLGPVNTVTYVDNNRRFVSTSDDKKAMVWEYGIPTVIKRIEDPEMHSMPYVDVHPSKDWFCCQSQDNQIVTYSAKRGFKANRKKRFVGHLTAGYACGLHFSPDGQFVISGDGEGRLFVWDWRSCRRFQRFQAHSQVCIGVQWNPLETSKVATCSWDGTIKYWD